MYDLDAILTNENWRILGLILPVLESFMVTQRKLENQKCMPGGCLVIAIVHDIHQGLNDALGEVPGM